MPRRAIIQFHVVNRNRNNNNDVRYPLIHMRDHLFHVAFVRIALIYATVFNRRARKIIEFFFLTSSFLSLVLLSYIHVAFVQAPTNCLEHVQEQWPRDGILRVEIMKEKLIGKYTLEKSYLREKKIKEMDYIDLSYFFQNSGIDDDEDYQYLMEMADTTEVAQNSSDSLSFTDSKSSFNVSIDEELNSRADDTTLLPTLAWTDDEYIMEFSLEYGFLKLSPSVRKQYNISVKLVTLNPSVDKCFGGSLNNFILHNFLGYDEVLLASLKLLASKEEYKGYVRNTLSETEFVFINAWMDKKAYITAGFVMMVFTISISILLRYSHHQIFVFIVELLHMFEFQSSFNFPAGPLLSVILALVGMEAIMSEFFNDTAIAFYVILIVWVADQYDTICCKSPFTKKHWLRFFYLYHFFFYAYSYRFGHNRFLALLTSWLFTLHSMVYFFHRYELPILTSQTAHRNYDPRNSGNPSPPAPPNEEAPNNQSQDSSVDQSDSEGSSNVSNLPNSQSQSTSSDQIDSVRSSDTSSLSQDASSVQYNSGGSSDAANLSNNSLHSVSSDFVRLSDLSNLPNASPIHNCSDNSLVQHKTCLIVCEDNLKNASASDETPLGKYDVFSHHMRNMSLTIPKLKQDFKTLTKLSVTISLLKRNIKTISMIIKLLLVSISVLLFCSRTLNLFFSEFYSYENLRSLDVNFELAYL